MAPPPLGRNVTVHDQVPLVTREVQSGVVSPAMYTLTVVASEAWPDSWTGATTLCQSSGRSIVGVAGSGA